MNGAIKLAQTVRVILLRRIDSVIEFASQENIGNNGCILAEIESTRPLALGVIGSASAVVIGRGMWS